jgi:hypothetical protein
LQFADALIVYESLGQYIEVLARILFRGNLHSEKVQKLAIYALYRVVNTSVYN